jgi:hypothetical protein
MAVRLEIPVLALMAGFVSVFPGPAVADFVPTVPAAVSATSASIGNPYQVDAHPYSSLVEDAFGSATATVVTAPFVSLTATVTATDGIPVGYSAWAHLIYHFVVVGGTPGVSVPVLISTNLTTTGNYPNLADAQITVTTDPSGPIEKSVQETVYAGPFLDYPSSFSGTLSLAVVPGIDNVVDLYVSVGNSYLRGGVLSASADPLIVVDPNLPNAADYSIFLSQGVGNGLAANVPVPSTIIMLSTLVPVILAGRYMRRSRRVACR